MVRRVSPENKEDPGDTKPRGLTNTNIISNAGDTLQMITNVSTADTTHVSPISKLQPRPATRHQAADLIFAMAKGAAILSADDDNAIEQCARILSVCLWHDVDESAWAVLVEDMTRSELLKSGKGSLFTLFGDDDTLENRGSWIDYYDHQIAWHVDELLAMTGYGR